MNSKENKDLLQDLVENQLPEISENQFIAGLVGGHKPSTYSSSPQIWNAAFANFNIPARYLAFDVPQERFGDFMLALKNEQKLRGLNVTIPYKKQVIDFLDEVEDYAKVVEAVNTVVAEEDRFLGSNTDGDGLVMATEEEFGKIKSKKILQIGAGETGNAVAYKLAEAGAKVRIINRTASKAVNLAKVINHNLKPEFKVEAAGEEEVINWAPEADFIVNASTKGFGEFDKFSALWLTNDDNLEKSAEIAQKIPKETIFIDIIFAPSETVMLAQAKETGHRIQNGLGMLIYQAVLAFEKIFTNEVKSGKISRAEILKIMRQGL